MRTGKCERCGAEAELRKHKVNQFETISICEECRDQDSEKRSKVATGKAGRPPKSPSQLEIELWKSYLSSVDSKTLELELSVQGHKGTRGQMLKSLLLSIIAKARRRRR